jgi:hypothetical protein
VLTLGHATALSLALAVVASIALADASSATAAVVGQGHATSCQSHRAHALKRTPQVIVWSKRTGNDPDSGGPLTTLYACLRPGGASIAIGRRAGDGGEYPGNDATSNLHVTGTLVSDLYTTGIADQAACGKYEPGNPVCATVAHQTARIYNLGTGKSLNEPLPAQTEAYAFTAAGALAWEAPTSPGVTGSPLMLGALGFDPSSLLAGPAQTLDRSGGLTGLPRFTGLTLQWTDDGQPRSVTLTATS